MKLKLKLTHTNIYIHFITLVGSRLHGLENKESDYDLKFVYTYSWKDINGLDIPQDSLDDKNTSPEDKKIILDFLAQYLPDKELHDFSGFEARKFFKNAMKSEPNMLDMLWADTVLLENDESPLFFCSNQFREVLRHRAKFVNFNQAKQRFLGMSFNTFKLGKKENGRSKDLAKSLQTLFSFLNMVNEGEHSPVLKPSQKSEVLAVKFNTFFMEHSELVGVVSAQRLMLEEECNELVLPETEDNSELLNRLLLSLSTR